MSSHTAGSSLGSPAVIEHRSAPGWNLQPQAAHTMNLSQHRKIAALRSGKWCIQAQTRCSVMFQG